MAFESSKAVAKDDQKVTGVTIQYSTDESTWTEVKTEEKEEDGTAIPGTSPVPRIFTNVSGNFDALFDEVTARYIRITVQSWISYPAMRAGLLIASPSGGKVDLVLRDQRIDAIAAIRNMHFKRWRRLRDGAPAPWQADTNAY